MIILGYPGGHLSLLFILIDIVIFFLGVRLLRNWLRVSCFDALDKAGSLIVFRVIDTVRRCVNPNLSENSSLVLGITVLSVFKLLILGMLSRG
ncbi:hypothetical protein SMSP2_01769 [Limihaloglobus sulfuriphilus]|uniref:Uncharacterized protein n=1 Tax=Limihaloglobus sulfuriphilus TaxID=1851148 RepID=A0A1Q2MFA9_9BACT|nr:hypothetical protein [Limihaloglobus sulfuriphilus]AQQ71395.1 hypothetical protein SMSP2_01769 [Limihaloglobus sulfuriphilus]